MGSVPTENLPTKSHKTPQQERRQIVRFLPVSSEMAQSTSGQYVAEPHYSDINDLHRQLDQKNIHPWKLEGSDGDIRILLHDETHSVPKYTVAVSSNLEFCIFVFNWPLPDCHYIYKEHKRSLKYLDVVELLEQLENATLCEGLSKDDEVMSVASDPTSNQEPSPTSIVRHTIPKAIQTEEPHFEVTLYYRSVFCDVIKKQKSKEICKPCSSAFSSVKRAARKKSKASATPAKPLYLHVDKRSCEPL